MLAKKQLNGGYMNKQEKIKAMYFNEKHKQKEIAKKLNVSNTIAKRNHIIWKRELSQEQMYLKK